VGSLRSSAILNVCSLAGWVFGHLLISNLYVSTSLIGYYYTLYFEKFTANEHFCVSCQSRIKVLINSSLDCEDERLSKLQELGISGILSKSNTEERQKSIVDFIKFG